MMYNKKNKKIHFIILLCIFAFSSILFLHTNKNIIYKETHPPVIVDNKQSEDAPDIYTENYNKTMKNIQDLKDTLQEGDEFIQDGDRITVKRKNGTDEKYEIVHGIAGDSLVKIS